MKLKGLYRRVVEDVFTWGFFFRCTVLAEPFLDGSTELAEFYFTVVAYVYFFGFFATYIAYWHYLISCYFFFDFLPFFFPFSAMVLASAIKGCH
jgi:hypothetical protein